MHRSTALWDPEGPNANLTGARGSNFVAVFAVSAMFNTALVLTRPSDYTSSEGGTF